MDILRATAFEANPASAPPGELARSVLWKRVVVFPVSVIRLCTARAGPTREGCSGRSEQHSEVAHCARRVRPTNSVYVTIHRHVGLNAGSCVISVVQQMQPVLALRRDHSTVKRHVHSTVLWLTTRRHVRFDSAVFWCATQASPGIHGQDVHGTSTNGGARDRGMCRFRLR